MSDIHQEWRELRQKNGDFLCHLDGEMAKIEKKQVELKRHEQMQDMGDAGAFAIELKYQLNCCQDDRDILKALDKAQADRIKILEEELLAYKEQRQIDLAVKKELDEKLDKAAADYKALWVESDNLRDTISRMEKTIRDLDERNGTLRESLAQTNASLKRSIQERSGLQSTVDYIRSVRKSQAKEIKRLQEIVNATNGSCSAYTQQGMQSKIAKQANEIKRLTEENEKLRNHNAKMSHMIDKLIDDASNNEILYHDLWLEKNNLKIALDQSAKDAEANFERGKIKGMDEIWAALQWAQDKCEAGLQLMPIYGYYNMADCVNSLTATAFLRKTVEWQEKEAREIKLGDEVEIFDQYDHSLSDIGIVVAMDKDDPCFAVIGPQFKTYFDQTDIDAGNVKKTGRHFDAITLDYLA